MKLYETDVWRQMMSGDPYDALNPVLVKELVRIRRMIKQYNDIAPGDTDALFPCKRGHSAECRTILNPD